MTQALYSVMPLRYIASREDRLAEKVHGHRTDEQLMEAYVRGELDAFDQLYYRYESKLFGFLVRMTRSRQVAEEIFQETFFHVIRSAAKFKSESFSGWVFTIARRQWIDRCRHEARGAMSALQSDEQGDLAERVPEVSDSPEQACYQGEVQEWMKRLLQDLPEEQREAFLLRVQGDLEYHEVADIVGVPMETIKSRVRYAVETLNRKLTRYRHDKDQGDFLQVKRGGG